MPRPQALGLLSSVLCLFSSLLFFMFCTPSFIIFLLSPVTLDRTVGHTLGLCCSYTWGLSLCVCVCVCVCVWYTQGVSLCVCVCVCVCVGVCVCLTSQEQSSTLPEARESQCACLWVCVCVCVCVGVLSCYV